MTESSLTPMNAADAILGPSLAAGFGSRPALWADGTTVSYDALDERVRRAASALRRLGIGPEQRVVLMLRDRPDFVATYLGIMRLGAVAVAVNTRMSPTELAVILADSRACLAIIETEFLAAAECARTNWAVAILDAHAFAALINAAEPETGPAAAMSPDDMAFWIYTSGTTGRPKAAVHTHRDVLAADRYLVDALGVGPGDRLYATSKLFFAYALGTCFFGALRLGAMTILSEAWPDAVGVAAVVAAARPTVMFSVPTLYRNLVRDGVAAAEPAFRDLRAFVSAGERLPMPLFELWQAATGRPILDGLGTSEVIYMIFANRLDALRPGTAGQVCAGVEIRLADDQGAEITEADRVGVLWVAMSGRCDRYWNQQALSRRVFQGEWFCTGDLVSRDGDGFFTHHGRADDLLRVSGQWVSPAEIEDVALAVPGIADAAVVGVPDADGLMRLVLFIVRAADAPDGIAAGLGQEFMARLAIFKCPKDIRIADALPRTATGKIQRFRLRDLAAQEVCS